MPLVGVRQAADDIIDIINMDGSNENDLMENEFGSDNGILTKAKNEKSEKETNLVQLLLNLVNSGNEKHMKLASDIMDLDLIKGNVSDNSDKNEQELAMDNNSENDMEWTTVKPKNKRVRSNSNDSEKITVSPSKKQKSNKANNKDDKSRQGEGQSGQNTRTKPEIRTRNALGKDSVLVTVTEIPENTYFNSIKMENMILNSFPKLKETGMWTKYRVNKRHQGKCYVTLPKDHLNENISEMIKSQKGFENSKVKVIKGINDVPEKAHKVVAIGVHQTISEDDIKTELAKNNVKINKVQRLKYNGQPTRKVVIQFENEQDMKIALYSGIYFGRIRIRCESYRTTPQVTQCYKCQGFNHIAKDCKNAQKCLRCAGAHKSIECPDKNKDSLKLKCSNCNGEHVASSKECPKFKEQIKVQADKAKARQEKLQNNLVVRGITFSNMVQNKTEKVQSVLAEKIQNNKKETELELGNIVQKLENKLEESFKALSEKVVSFMVNSMVEIYEKLDRKNADKVYSILSKESVDCFNIQLHPISPPLSPSTSVETSVSQVDISKVQNKPKKLPITQKVVPPRSRKPQNGSKK